MWYTCIWNFRLTSSGPLCIMKKRNMGHFSFSKCCVRCESYCLMQIKGEICPPLGLFDSEFSFVDIFMILGHFRISEIKISEKNGIR